ncbi:replication initiator protein [Microviridae sp.]|nr:replication initiator protein [Microviridae sp.]
MACSYPQEGFVSHTGTYTPNEKNSTGIPLTIPCGSCMQCKVKHSLDWAVRCSNEMQTHETSCFITLTYKDLPENGNLNHDHFKAFMDKLKKRLGKQPRYFMAGEYGKNQDTAIYGDSKLGRPHFHAIIFGYDFPDKQPFKKSYNGEQYYTSELLNKLWKYGNCIVTAATFQTAAYVSRYITKKIKGDMAEDHYQRIDKETGEVVTLSPEYNKQSNRPGLGKDWLIKYFDDVFPSDEIIISGRTYQVPRYYTKILKKENPQLSAEVEGARQLTAYERKLIDTDTRDYWKKAIDSETNMQAKLIKKIRGYENNA